MGEFRISNNFQSSSHVQCSHGFRAEPTASWLPLTETRPAGGKLLPLCPGQNRCSTTASIRVSPVQKSATSWSWSETGFTSRARSSPMPWTNSTIEKPRWGGPYHSLQALNVDRPSIGEVQVSDIQTTLPTTSTRTMTPSAATQKFLVQSRRAKEKERRRDNNYPFNR